MAEAPGAGLPIGWGLPFAGLLLSIAVMPLVAGPFWHRHHGKVAAAWALAFLVPFAMGFGPGAAAGALVHTVMDEYIPFTVLLLALYTAAGGIYVRGALQGSPGVNVAIMAVGSVLASVMGTTGASMLLIRPLIRANENRRNISHVVVFFIFTVSNVGGSLTPLGDPPLFLGFLRGVSFFWTLDHILAETVFLLIALLLVFFLIDTWHCRREGIERSKPTVAQGGVALEGSANLLPLAAVVGLVLMSGIWKPGIVVDVLGTGVPLQALVRDSLLLAVTGVSLAITPPGVREKNQFTWAPMQEVATLFIGIFVTMVPVLGMLKSGAAGPFSALVHAVTGSDGQPLPAAYFWLCGLLSSFLDNAPTYLVFFNLAGGDPAELMTRGAATLAAISAGSVFMGANSYIGNAPNFMVKAIAEERGVVMPSFFGYLLWSGAVLLPLFAIVTLFWFR
jgi:Na+/H+ antiporter NhaD/arsenite permease-like protein